MKTLFTFCILCCIGIISDAAGQQARNVPIPGTEMSVELIDVPGGDIQISQNVKLSIEDFSIGKYEVTYDQWALFQYKENDASVSSNPNIDYNVDAISRPTPPYEDFSKGMGQSGGFPAVSITQQGALRFCNWLYEKTGVFFRLPSEAEWQYMCEKGNTKFNDNTSWNFDNSFDKFHKVGKKEPNDLGIYDLLGNMAEWTMDSYTKNYPEEITAENWIFPTRKHSRTVKGGSYLSDESECNCAFRERSNPRWQMRDPQIPKSKWWNTDAPFIGFRVLTPKGKFSNEEVKAYFAKAIID